MSEISVMIMIFVGLSYKKFFEIWQKIITKIFSVFSSSNNFIFMFLIEFKIIFLWGIFSHAYYIAFYLFYFFPINLAYYYSEIQALQLYYF